MFLKNLPGYCLILLHMTWLVGCGSMPTRKPDTVDVKPPTLLAGLHFTYTATLLPTRTHPPATDLPTWTPTSTFTPAPSDTPVPTETATPTPQLCSPVATLTLDQLWQYISVPYLPPPMGEDARHQGIDISYYRLAGVSQSILGAGVQAVLPGVVAAAIAASFPFGNLVIIETPRFMLPEELIAQLKIDPDHSLYILYAHLLSTPLVSLGQQVSTCQLIGYVGQSGNTSAPHLHLETRRGPPEITFEVFSAFAEGVTPLEAANYRRWRIGGEFIHFDPMLLLDPLHPSPTTTARPTKNQP